MPATEVKHWKKKECNYTKEKAKKHQIFHWGLNKHYIKKPSDSVPAAVGLKRTVPCAACVQHNYSLQSHRGKSQVISDMTV